MKKLLPIFLASSILFQSLVGAFLVLSYQWQKKEIAATLCVNKNLPSKGCEGKCYLKKQLKKAEEAENTLPGIIKEKLEIAYTLQEPLHFSFYKIKITEKYNSFYSFFIPEQPTFSRPHPPSV